MSQRCTSMPPLPSSRLTLDRSMSPQVEADFAVARKSGAKRLSVQTRMNARTSALARHLEKHTDKRMTALREEVDALTGRVALLEAAASAAAALDGANPRRKKRWPPRSAKRPCAEECHSPNSQLILSPQSTNLWSETSANSVQQAPAPPVVSSRNSFTMGYMEEIDEKLDRLEEQRKDEAAQTIKSSSSCKDLLDNLDMLIEDEWLGGLDELHGNIYRAWALGSLHSEGIFDFSFAAVYRNLVTLGAIVVLLLQTVGPVVLVHHIMTRSAEEADVHIRWEKWWPTVSHWQQDFVSSGTRLLALLFVLVLNLNNVAIVLSELETWRKINELMVWMECDQKRGCRRWLLIVGAFANSWSVCLCSVGMTGALAQSETPKDVLFDALALLFLFNLDDIGGELAFVSDDDWPGHELAWMHKRLELSGEKVKTGWGHRIWFVTWVVVVLQLLLQPAWVVMTDYSALVDR